MQNRLTIIFNIFIVTIFILSLSACGGTTPSVAKKKPLPSWISAVLPNDTRTKMYGLAIAEDRDMAIKSALSDMIAKQGTTIESSFDSKEVVEQFYSSSVVKFDIKSSVSKIKVNNYKVIKSYRINYNEFAVMIETDKIKFIQGLKNDFDVEKKAIDQEYDTLANQDILHRYNGKKTLANRASKLIPLILMLSTLDKSIDKDVKMKFVLAKKKAFLDEANSLKFYISGNKKSMPFVDKLKNNLAHNGFNVVNSKENAVLIKLDTNDNVNGSKVNIVVITIKISVHNISKRIGGKTIIIKERYNNSLQSVYKNASIHFKQDIKSKGIKDLIGMNLDTTSK